ncbi:uncharacterized protein LOC131883411 [Tigriopus californicus]|uniref:uncharacterized protein LOC131883411 n=1 Tax=Tigriopus californicus TaxID=6832 RepID=UPI0027D9E8CF|nr:uncharacterized protein LOC131883411 [Tigriopus californicus]
MTSCGRSRAIITTAELAAPVLALKFRRATSILVASSRKTNPADLASRGLISAQDIPPLWFKGPDFLCLSDDQWPQEFSPQPSEKDDQEVRSKFHQSQVHACTRIVGEGFENLEMAVQSRIESGGLNNVEALHELICEAQLEAFREEFNELQSNKTVSKSSRLNQLSPFLDTFGIIRARGRIGLAEVGYDQKHPIILCPKSPLTILIVEQRHVDHHHPGVNHLMGILRQTYWILRGQELVKKVRLGCRKCQIQVARPANQEMADLPQERLAIGRPPFFHTSVDFFGPLEVLVLRNKIEKRNFVNTRGQPQSMYSDNGTNFVGANNLFVELESKKPEKIKSVRWKFQVPGAPHWGGIHESLVRSAKTAMANVLDQEQSARRHLRDYELRTI